MTTMDDAAGKGWSGVVIAVCAIAMTVLCILWNLDVHTRLGFAILTEQYLAAELGLAICILFLSSTIHGRQEGPASIPGAVLAFLGLATLAYTAWAYPALLYEQAYRPPILTFIGGVTVFLVLEGVRRSSGWTLWSIVVVFLVYALVAHLVPGPLVGSRTGMIKLIQYAGFDPSAVYSTPLAVGTIIVLLFIFFGRLLFMAGGGEFFTDLAMALTGRARGGSAKISVVGSALFGSISGSAVSNVVTTGVVTIPLMRRGGYSKTDAGAIEAIASTGGQLTPPIMGAAAFIMAEFLEMSYVAVAVAAIIPALLYYFSVFIQVDLIAARDQIKSEETGRRIGEVMREGWHLIIPFAVLLGALFWLQLDPQKSALWSAASIVVVGLVRPYRDHRLNLRKIIDVFVETGVSVVDLVLIVAAAGFVIGILNITGLNFALTLFLVDTVGSNLALILLVSAFICILLGMGMPTSGVYVLLAALVAPAIIEAGVDPIAAHMFILYFGMMSMITPPIALAAFAAATLTGDDPMRTGFASMRIGWASYIIPFVFVCTPSLLLQGSLAATVADTLATAIGVLAISAAITGYLTQHLTPVLRGLLAVLGLGCLPFDTAPAAWTAVNLACIVAVTGIAAFQFFMARRQASP